MTLAIKMGIALAILAVLSGICAGIYTAGKRSERAATAERDNKALRAAYEERDRLVEQVRALEEKSRTDVAAAESKAAKEIANAKTTADRAIADAADNQLRNLGPLCAASNRRAAAKAGTAARAAAEAEAAELRRAYVEPFVRLAQDADEVTSERNEAVEIALKDREVCR